MRLSRYVFATATASIISMLLLCSTPANADMLTVDSIESYLSDDAVTIKKDLPRLRQDDEMRKTVNDYHLMKRELTISKNSDIRSVANGDIASTISKVIDETKREFILPGSEMFELTALVPVDTTYHNRFDCAQSMCITDDGKIIVFQWEWGQTNDTRSSMFMVQEIDLESGKLLDTYYLPDCYDASTGTYTQNRYGGSHMHLNGSTYKDGKVYISDGSRIAVLDLSDKSLAAVQLPVGVSAGAISTCDDGFAVRAKGVTTILDSSLTNVVSQVRGQFDENQDFAVKDNLAYSVRWNEAGNYNAVNVYDLSTGELVEVLCDSIFTDSDGWTMEMEGVDFYNGDMYVLFNSWGGTYGNCVAKVNL